MHHTTDHHPEGFSGRRAADLAGISYRQLDYWARTGVIRPTLTDASGSGSRRAYSHRDVVELTMIAELLAGGVRLSDIRDVVPEIRATTERSLLAGTVIVTATGITVAETAADIMAALDQAGAMVVLPVSPIVTALDDRLDQERTTVAA